MSTSSAVAWTPDSRCVALVDGWRDEYPDVVDLFVGVWDAASGQLVHTFKDLGPPPVGSLQP